MKVAWTPKVERQFRRCFKRAYGTELSDRVPILEAAAMALAQKGLLYLGLPECRTIGDMCSFVLNPGRTIAYVQHGPGRFAFRLFENGLPVHRKRRFGINSVRAFLCVHQEVILA